MNVHKLIRQRLLRGLHFGPKTPPISELIRTEWSPSFEQLMRNRLLMGRFRYGAMSDPNKGAYDQIGSAIARLNKYKLDGNMEHLVDVANLCLVEFVHPNHPNAHFEATDDGTHVEAI